MTEYRIRAFLSLHYLWSSQTSSDQFALFQELIARYSGALAFLQTQHQTAGMFIAQGENKSLKQAYLPSMVGGELLIGVGFSHLRRRGAPSVTATPIDGGYCLRGNVPWVTGWGIFSEFIIGATLPDGETLLGLVPLANINRTILCSQPLALNALNSTNTVAVELVDWYLPRSRVVAIYPADWIQLRDRRSIRQRAIFPLGCARAGLDLVGRIAAHKPLESVVDVYQHLDDELQACREQVLHSPAGSLAEELKICSHAIDLALRCAQTAVVVTGGMANLQTHPAGRVYREALMSSISGQTPEILSATIAQISKR
jgi:alkylation response protein AidB-like acyl-CoA dehydrogenase